MKCNFCGDVILNFDKWHCDADGSIFCDKSCYNASLNDETPPNPPEVQLSPSGSKRYNIGKPQIHQVPIELLMGAAESFTRGEAKYGKWNWAKGNYFSVPYDSLMRHLITWLNGEDNDQESGLHHLKHAASNLAMLMHYVENYPDLDDRLCKSLKKEGQ
jgi:hypothetical protein